jgi:hypothetical protein
VRLARRKFLHAACLLGFVALALPGTALWALGFTTGVRGAEWAGAITLAAGSCFLALDAALIVRQLGTNLDYEEWHRAGRPESWGFRQWSQPRSSDLAVAAIGSALLAWFFLALTLG